MTHRNEAKTATVKREGWIVIVIQPVRGLYGTCRAEMLHGIIFETAENARDSFVGVEEWSGYQVAKVEWEE